MQYDEYQKLAMRTECDQELSRKRINGTAGFYPGLKTNSQTRLIHAALGMVSDVEELFSATDRTNLKEEIGDLFWYLVQAYSAMGKEIEYLDSITIAEGFELLEGERYSLLEMNLRESISMYCEKLEHRIYYGQEDCRKVLMSLQAIQFCLEALCTFHGFPVIDILRANIAKLQKRYPTKFDPEMVKEENRDRVEEAKAIDDGPNYSNCNESIKGVEVEINYDKEALENINKILDQEQIKTWNQEDFKGHLCPHCKAPASDEQVKQVVLGKTTSGSCPSCLGQWRVLVHSANQIKLVCCKTGCTAPLKDNPPS